MFNSSDGLLTLSHVCSGGANPGGSAIENQGTLLVTNSTFSGNGSSSDPEGFGSSLYNIGGTLTVANSTFPGNLKATGGGGTVFIAPALLTTAVRPTRSR